VLFRVIREGIGFTQRLTATGTVRLQALRMLTLEPERLKNQLATTRKRSPEMEGSSRETLKRLAISVCQRRSFGKNLLDKSHREIYVEVAVTGEASANVSSSLASYLAVA
jgi:hypothetical protein